MLGGTPRLATAAWLDEVGAAAKKLEEALGDTGVSPFAEAMKHSSRAVEDFVTDVGANFKDVGSV